MASGKFVAYYRVSTAKQGQSGLGIEAQHKAVATALASYGGELVGEYREVETGKGANALAKRPQLAAALAQCKKHRATLIIAKLDRLARNVHFVSGLLETGVEFVAADMPNANKTMIHMHAVMSEWERDQISERTKAALAAAKARGAVLGLAGPSNLKPHLEARKAAADAFAGRLEVLIRGFQRSGLTQRAMVGQLNALGIATAKGGQWSLIQLQRVIRRLGLCGRPHTVLAQ